MARMYSPGSDEPSGPVDRHPGVPKSYHMQLADQMDQQAGGTSWPGFMRTPKGAIITGVVMLILVAALVMGSAVFG